MWICKDIDLTSLFHLAFNCNGNERLKAQHMYLSLFLLALDWPLLMNLYYFCSDNERVVSLLHMDYIFHYRL